MASFSLHVEDLLPNGTTVSALKHANYAISQRPPTSNIGTVDATATVTSGVATFTGLADDTSYFATATVSGNFRVVSFRTPALAQAQTVGAGSLTDIARNRGYQRTGAIAENFSRVGVNVASSITSGTLRVVGMLMLPGGKPVSSITTASSGTAAVTPTNQWYCLIDPTTRNILATTLDDTTTAWPINQEKPLLIASALGGSTPGTYTPPSDIAVQVGILVVAATPPTLLAITTNSMLAGQSPALSINSSTGLTTPASLGSQAAAYSSAAGTVPWVYVS